MTSFDSRRRQWLVATCFAAFSTVWSSVARAAVKTFQLSGAARSTGFRSAPLLNRYRDVLLRRGDWSALSRDPKRTFLIDNELRVIAGGPPPGSIFLGYGDIERIRRDGTHRYFCDVNVTFNPPSRSAAGPDCDTMTTDDCDKLGCIGHHCNGNTCKSLDCEVHSCAGATCGSLSTKVVAALSQEMSGNWDHPFLVEMRDQLQINDVRQLAREVKGLVSNAAMVR